MSKKLFASFMEDTMKKVGSNAMEAMARSCNGVFLGNTFDGKNKLQLKICPIILIVV